MAIQRREFIRLAGTRPGGLFAARVASEGNLRFFGVLILGDAKGNVFIGSLPGGASTKRHTLSRSRPREPERDCCKQRR